MKRSLAGKILLAIGATVAGVIAIYTYFVIRVQSAWWHERTQAQNLIATTMVHEYLNGVMLSDRHQELHRFLAEMKASQEIARGRIVKPDGAVVFSTETQEIGRAVMTLPAELFKDKRVLQGTRDETGQRFAVAMRPVASSESCRQCHADTGALGAIVLERSFGPAEANIASNRNLLISYGAAIFILVGVVLWLLISRFVTQPVGALLDQMRRVQAGDLAARAPVESRDEVGELAAGFNAMVGSLDTTTRELRDAHERQIRQASKLASIGELAAGIAHEIRNPLAGIGAAVEVLGETGNGQHAEVTGEIRRQITRLNRTLRDLLEFSRTREPEMTDCEVPALIESMLTLVRPDAQKQGVRIVEEIAPGLPAIRADAGQVQQALLNVLLNAIQAMPEGGTLTLGAQASNGDVQIRVCDTGEGIAPENRARIFSPFFTTKHRGTGLGLAITRSIVEKHGGAIRVESEVGRGTTFTLEFHHG